MSIEYLGLSEINGPLVVLEGVKGAAYDEIVEFKIDGTQKKLGRIIEDYEDKAVIQVFEGTDGMSLKNTHTKLTGHPMELALSEEILGRTFDGIGRPIDGLGPIVSDVRVNVNGMPLNPCRREYPRNYINTGISAIDGLTTLIRGQKLPIFSGNGWSHSRRWVRGRMRGSALYLPRWASSMMSRSFSGEHLRRAVFPIMLRCSSILRMILSLRGSSPRRWR